MPIPNGYTKIEANKLYENVEYYIDTTASTDYTTIDSNISQYPYLGDTGGTSFGVIDANDNSTLVADWDDDRWYTDNIVDGIVTGYPTLNINLTTSPDWLYVKTAPDYSGVKKVNITDENGNEFSFDLNKVQERKTVTITESGSYSVDPDEGYDGIAGVGITVDIEAGTGLAEAATEADMTNLAATNDVGYVARYSGDTTENYENGRLYVLVEEDGREIMFDIGDAFGYFTALEGMTWAEWCDSDYNTYDFVVNDGGNIAAQSGAGMLVSDGTKLVVSSDVIQEGYSYEAVS